MNPHTHFLFSFFIAVVLVKLNILSWKLAVICGVIGVLIDLDHYIEYILHSKTNRFSLKACWNNSIKLHRFNQRSFIHHRIGIIILTVIFLIILFFNLKAYLVLAIGYYSHLFLDYLHFKKEKYFRERVGDFYFKEAYVEIILDAILVLGLIILFLV